MAAGFIFFSVYLGSVRGYYGKFWWWDVALHTSSGFILGIAGFLADGVRKFLARNPKLFEKRS